MKTIIGIALPAALLIYGAAASGEEAQVTSQERAAPKAGGVLDWGPAASSGSARASAPAAVPEPLSAETDLPELHPGVADIDVVDAHWMALTMWGEARREGEIGLRAVGHVIDNRRRSGRHGAYATDTISQAYQFSCWNANDPNRAAMENVDRLRPGSADHQAWQYAKRIAAEILEGRSADPTGGALFYHTVAVAPRWSVGIAPVRRVGSHLFFLHAR